MRILFLTPWYPDEKKPNHGIFVRDQVAALASRHQVVVISAKVDYSRFSISSLRVKKNNFTNLSEVRINVSRSIPIFNQLNFFFRVTLASIKECRQFRPDLVHGNIGYPGAFWAWAVAKILKVPFVVTEHTRLVNNFRSAFHRFLTLFGLKRAKAIISVSRWHAEEIYKLTGIRPFVVHNIINLSKYPGVTSRPQGNIQMGFLGGLSTPVKGLDLLLEACAKLDGDFRLHVGGDGSLFEHYKQLSQQLGVYEKCEFYGAISHEKVLDFMAKLHFFVSASRSETFGVAMVEAMACGLPVVATDSGGPREFITAQNGLLVAIHSEALAEGLQTMMNTYKTYDPLIVRNSVIEKFSDKIFVQALDSIYAQVARPGDIPR